MGYCYKNIYTIFIKRLRYSQPRKLSQYCEYFAVWMTDDWKSYIGQEQYQFLIKPAFRSMSNAAFSLV